MTTGPEVDPSGSEQPQGGERPGADVLTVDEALAWAMDLHRQGSLETAEQLYDSILEIEPTSPVALHYLGILHHQTGRSEGALTLIGQAIMAKPEDPHPRNNLGNILTEMDRPEEAARAYQAALELDPSNADAHSNLGAILRILGHLDAAEASYRRAIAANPEHQPAFDNLGRLLGSRGRIKEAILCHAKALELAPHDAKTRRLLVAAYAAGDEPSAALAILDEWLRDSPDDATALHLRAAISGHNVPERASDPFVELTFDRFAASFDAKLAKLDYQAPQIVAEAVRTAYGPPKGDLDVLDAGCGTGLCGPLLKPFAAWLTGVDLSSQMLRKAEAREVYDTLCKAELTRFLLDHAAAFDLIVSADTLCYFGALQDVLAASASALRPAGTLVFSVEEDTEALDFRLNHHGRYSHNVGYVNATLAAAGLDLVILGRDPIRQERGEDVAGLFVTARKR